jgi:predicted enzyme related to lactoylglutathione lyase
MAHTHHGIDYVELPASDVAAAKEFYGSAFGWQFTDYGPGYAGIQAPDGDGEVGGLNGFAEDSSARAGTGGPLVLLYSDDLDDSVAAVESAGGTVVDPPFDFPGGRRFHFTDPTGNRLGVWQEAPPAG